MTANHAAKPLGHWSARSRLPNSLGRLVVRSGALSHEIMIEPSDRTPDRVDLVLTFHKTVAFIGVIVDIHDAAFFLEDIDNLLRLLLRHTRIRIRKSLLSPERVSSAIDPCIGDGVAFEAITSGAEVLRYGFELDAYRAEQARQWFANIVQGNTLEVQCAVECFGLLYLNPPYDWALGP